MAGSFSIEISKFIQKAKARTDTVVQHITMEVFSNVIRMSPVGNPDIWLSLHPYTNLETGKTVRNKAPYGYSGGRFRGNWVASVGGYSTNTYDTIDKQGKATVAKAARVVKQSKAGGIVYLVNNLPYSIRLEYGYSRQAPIGMVGVTIANYQNYVRNAIN